MKIIRIVDLETTGLAPPAEVCELAFIDVDESREELARFQSFARPFDDSMSPEARAVHHIAPDDLLSSPRWPQVLFHVRAVHSRPDIIVAHNAAFERQWLATEFPDSDWSCTL